MTSFFAVRTEADLLALIPFTLGFHPEDSLVLVTTARAGAPFHARIDLPHDPADLAGVVRELLQAAVCNGADQALVVAYTEDEGLAEAAARRLVRELAAAGIETHVQLRADGSRWFPLGLRRPDLRSLTGVPYDVRAHPLTSHAVLHGKV